MNKFEFSDIGSVVLHKVIDSISDGFVVIDEYYNIIDYNKTFYDYAKELINVKKSINLLDEISKCEHINISNESITEIINKGREDNSIQTVELAIAYKEQEKIFDLDITPIFSHDKYAGTILILKDITAITKAHKQLIEQEKFSALGQLIGGIAHDLNSRLYALDGQMFLLNNLVNEIKDTEKLERNDYIEISEDMQKRIDDMKLAINSMSKTISSVRNYTRSHSEGNIETFSIGKVMENVQTLLNQKFKRHNCRLSYIQNIDGDINIKGDFSKLEGVLINIISNAVEAYEENGVKKGGPVEVFAEEKGAEVIISITNYGKEIPDNIKDLIFKEILTTKGSHGTGMGLYFSHSIIVGSFKGSIWFQSEKGKGTTFYIRLPKSSNKMKLGYVRVYDSYENAKDCSDNSQLQYEGGKKTIVYTLSLVSRMIQNKDIKQLRVLDAGCGNGRTTLNLLLQLRGAIIKMGKNVDIKVVGIDISKNMVDIAVKSAAIEGINTRELNFYEKNIEELNENDAYFDVVFSNYTLHLCTSKVYQRFNERLNRGGMLAINQGGVNNNRNLHEMAQSVMNQPEFKEYFVDWKIDLFYPSKSEVMNFLKNAGFKNISVDEEEYKDYNYPEAIETYINVSLKVYLDPLPNNELKKLFEERFRELAGKQSDKYKHVHRLYITAVKP